MCDSDFLFLSIRSFRGWSLLFRYEFQTFIWLFVLLTVLYRSFDACVSIFKDKSISSKISQPQNWLSLVYSPVCARPVSPETTPRALFSLRSLAGTFVGLLCVKSSELFFCLNCVTLLIRLSCSTHLNIYSPRHTGVMVGMGQKDSYVGGKNVFASSW